MCNGLISSANGGSGTIYLKGQGNLLRIDGGKDGAKKTLTLDGVTLAGVDNNTYSLVNVMNGGEFVLKSGAISGNTIDGWGGGVSVGGEAAVFTMQGGAISNNTASGSEWSGGGGVIVSGEAAIFVMQGGVISGNTVTGGDPWGGGVSLTR
ncbi:MAG: hypothetical protein LBH51_10580, partial [Treponema sp.]|nr:hypothetical protein [Treponema sp.]